MTVPRTTIEAILEEELTAAQRNAAIDAAADILMIACAGSGKSRTLAYRIAWLISQGAEPESIVAFTFTNAAAEAIQQRVATALARVGRPPTELGKIRIGTIHGFCQQLLKQIDARYRQFEVLDENGLRLFLMSRYPELRLQRFQSRSSRYFDRIKGFADAWTTLHDEVLEIEEVHARDPELGSALLRLEELLDESNYIDFSLMIRLIVDRLDARDPQALVATGHIRHLLVDEYQDINPLEERLIQLLKKECDSLTVVGDDDQSIYAWRGADVSNILGFKNRNSNASEHTLAHNFRSTPLIVRSADALVRAELGASRLLKDPEADQGQGPHQLGVFGFADRPTEAAWIADRIAALLGSPYYEENGVRGLTPADFAILMRSTGGKEKDGTSRSSAFTTALEEQGIPYTLEAGGTVFARRHVAVLRDAMELLREDSPVRPTVVDFVASVVRPLFPDVDEAAVIFLYEQWGRDIHTSIEVERRRVYPQQLLHDFLAAFGVSKSQPDDGAMADIGVLSRLLSDVETAYVSIDTPRRFQGILNFMQNLGEGGYQSATDAAVRRPDAVTVSTVHKAKGLEYPVVFVADAEAQRFPLNESSYSGWLPSEMLREALNPPRRAYGNDRGQEARLFYTALTRAERFLYVTHAAHLPGGAQVRRESPFSARLTDESILSDVPIATDLPDNDLPKAAARRRVDETVLPTTFSEIRYYLRCPRDYRYRHVWGFSAPIPELFGFGQAVHAAVGKLHEVYQNRPPTTGEAEAVARDLFHVKHVPPSNDPVNRPGAYERAADASARIVTQYAREYAEDFQNRRQLEVPFEIPLRDSVLSGSIDLLLHLDQSGNILDASVVDFKTMEGGPEPESNPDLDWTELALQVQLYARAADAVLDARARTGAVHLLRDGQRIDVPVDDEAIEAAVQNVEWAAQRIIADDFPMRPHADKCSTCDWRHLCPMEREEFDTDETPPPLHLPDAPNKQLVPAVGQVAP
ncbi:MAG: ATP-dependent DNA helicase [Chloroflexota bacterium]|nr:ATP-dependent DNA helicase [Chloroflexota bacterium]